MTDLQRRAIDFYFENGFVAKQAMISAGYAKNTATYNPGRWSQQPQVIKEIARRQKVLADRHEVTQDWVIERLKRIADAPAILAKYKKVTEDGQLAWDFTDATQEDLAVINELATDMYSEGRGKGAKIIKKMKIGSSDPMAALNALCRHLGMFNDKVTVEGELSLIERIQAGRKQSPPKGEGDDGS